MLKPWYRIPLYALLATYLIILSYSSWSSTPDKHIQSGQIKRTDNHSGRETPAITAEDRTADYTLWLAVLTGGLVLVAGGQLAMFVVQLQYMRQGMEDAKIVAEAAKLSAAAAVASLEKPWLFVNKPIHNQSAWIAGDGALSVVFSITNYGKAPAIILSITGMVFVSPGLRNKVSEIGVDPSITPIIDFPVPDDLRIFLNEWGRSPRGVAGTVPFRPSDIALPIERKHTAAYAIPFVIGGGETSSDYWIIGKMPFQRPPEGIPIESAMNAYFVGRILYHGLSEEPEIFSFCYESPPHGEFKVFLGAPYNERSKANP